MPLLQKDVAFFFFFFFFAKLGKGERYFHYIFFAKLGKGERYFHYNVVGISIHMVLLNLTTFSNTSKGSMFHSIEFSLRTAYNTQHFMPEKQTKIFSKLLH